jgi:polyferredoxin
MHSYQITKEQKTFTYIGLSGLGVLLLTAFGVPLSASLALGLGLGLISLGVLGYTYSSYASLGAGIKNTGLAYRDLTSRGVIAWVSGVLLTSFYILLYFYSEYLEGLIRIFDGFSYFLSGRPATQWFVYGVFYTLAIILFGIKFLVKYRHVRYQRLRTLSIIFFQTAFAFLIPELMARLNGDLPYYDLKSVWPLNYYLFDGYALDGFLNSGSLGLGLLIFGIVSIIIITPILTYKYGKRWYCSWVCGCGGLAETAGDPFRQLSDKSLRAWKLERWMIHTVLVWVFLSTVAVVHSYLLEHPDRYLISPNLFLSSIAFLVLSTLGLIFWKRRNWLAKDAKTAAIVVGVISIGLLGFHFFSGNTDVFFIPSAQLRSTYGFFIGAIFSGVIGTGFYPILGNRVWCRFGCPMAAILGIQQKLFSKFQISTNGGQCISCGNCSTYCEMGIDVRAYAQKSEPIKRASCVGCGICSAVCPRGVLRLES